MQDTKNSTQRKIQLRPRRGIQPRGKLRPQPLLDTLQTSDSKDPIDTWAERRKNAENIADLYDSIGLHRQAQRMRDCMKMVTKVEFSCGHQGYVTTREARRCGCKFCPDCQRIESGKQSRMLTDVLLPYIERHDLHAHFLTLTFKDAPYLSAFDLSAMSGQTRKLLKSKIFEPYGYHGAYRVIEVHLTKRGKWHPHYHIVLLTDKPIPLIESGNREGNWQNSFNQAVSDEWHKITGDSFIVQGMQFDGNMRELAKYLHKGSVIDLSRSKFAELVEWSDGMRRSAFIGKLHNNPEIRERKEAHRAAERENLKSPRCAECGCNEHVIRHYRWSYPRMRYVPCEKLTLTPARGP
jgi:hypothetical protein